MLSICFNNDAKLWKNKDDPQRITKIKFFTDKYIWEGINYPSQKYNLRNWQKFTLNVLYVKKNGYMSFLGFKMLLTFWKSSYFFNEPKPRSMELSSGKKVAALLKTISSKNVGDFYCLNCIHSFRTKITLKSHKKVSKEKKFCHIVMPFER